MLEYGLGIDLGTTYSAAAINVDGAIETVRLGGRTPEIPSLVYLRDDGEVLVGEAAQRRGETDPTRLAREFKRRIGDPVPMRLGETPMAAHELTAALLRRVVATVAEGQGGPPRRIVLTHPANWGPYKRERLLEAARLADLPQVTLRTEPEAAAIRYAGTARVAVGETIAVYDLGGGTFDAAVLRKTADGFEVLGEPQGVEQLGGIDFDEAVLEHVRATLGDQLAGLDLDDPAVTEALSRLRRECVEAKESLSFDIEAEIGVALPRLHTRVRIKRDTFEAMISPALEETVAAVRRALRSASVPAEELRCVVLAGGSSRIPLVGLMVSRAFERPVVIDEQPELGIALGAARLSGPAAAQDAAAPVVLMPTPRDPAPAGPADRQDIPRAPLPPATVVGAAAVPGQNAGPLRVPAPGGAPAQPPSGAAAMPPTGSAAGPPGGAAAGAPGGAVAGVPGGGAAGPFGAATPLRSGAAGVPPFGGAPAGSGGGSWLRSKRVAVIGGFAAVLLVIGAITAVAAWPRDRAKGGGEPVAAGNQTSVSAGPAVDEAELLWRANTGVAAVEPPAVSAERIVVSGQDGTLRSYRRADGTLEWKVALGAGTRAATHIAGGVVVAATDDGHLIGIDPAQGKVRWRKDVGGQIGARPLTAGVLAYAGGQDGVLTAYGIGNGDRRWRLRTQGEISRPPTVIGGVVVVASGDGKLYGVSPDGEKLWTATAGQVTDGPVGTGHAACVAVDNGTVRCVQSEDGAELDGIADTVTIEGIAGGDGVLYTAGSDGSVGAWDPATAKQLWRKPGSGGSVRLIAAAGEVDVAYPDGSLAGLDAGSGEVRWRNTTGDKFSIAPGSDGAGLFAVGDSGVLYALRPPAGAVVPPTPSVEPTTEPATEPTAENRETRHTTKPTYYRSTRPSRTASPSASTTATTTPPTTEPTSQPSGA